MNDILMYSATGFVLFFLGLYFVAFAPLVITRILAINIMGVGIFMFLVAHANSHNGVTDPVPHALILTGIVVAVAGTALALVLVKKIQVLSHNQNVTINSSSDTDQHTIQHTEQSPNQRTKDNLHD